MKISTTTKLIFVVIGVLLSAMIVTRAVHWLLGMIVPVAVVGALGYGAYLYLNRQRALTDSRKNLP